MKKIIFIISFLLFAHSVNAQNEFYIAWVNDSLSLDGTNHITDENGNLYILGDLYPWDTLQGAVIPLYPYGNALIRIDKENKIIWQKAYFNYYPGSQLLFFNNSIYIPYSLDVGLNLCWQSPSGSIFKESSINAA